VHVIDAVLVPQAPLPATVVDIIVNSPNHTVLETAVIAAGLADDLSGTGPFTVFAPTDAAFAALPADVVTALLADPTGALAQVLLYHVVAGEALSSSLSNGQAITTLQGEDVVVSINGNGVFINNAQVIVADIMAQNGVVHVIDAVLTIPTSVSTEQSVRMSVYPNPCQDVVRLDVANWNGSEEVHVFDMTGARVLSQNVRSSSEMISLSGLAAGNYVMQLTSNHGVFTQSIVKE
jgi:Fasciclin domain/Secretion system C-terminal sorting domain